MVELRTGDIPPAFPPNPTLRTSPYINESGYGQNLAKLAGTLPGWREVDGYRERWREDDMSVWRVFNGPWADYKAFVDWLLGYSTTIPDPFNPGGLLLSRTPPHQHPKFPWMFAWEVEELTGVGAWRDDPSVHIWDANGFALQGGDPLDVFGPHPPIENPIIAYFNTSGALGAQGENCCNVRVRYTHRDYEIRNDAAAWQQPTRELSRYVSRFFKPAIIHLPLARLTNNLKFIEGEFINQVIPEAGAKLLPTLQLTMVWHQVPDIPWDAFNACTGRINANAFDGAPGYRSYPPGTLLCQAPEVKRMRSVTGRVIWQMTYRFDYRGNLTALNGAPVTWNHFPDGAGVFAQARFPAGPQFPTGQPVYESADFDQLFRPPLPVSYV